MLKDKNVLNLSGRESRLGLKVLGEGELPFPLTVKAETFSASAAAKIESAGGTAEALGPLRKKWTRKGHENALRAAGKLPPKQKTAYEIRLSLVGSEMCIRDRMCIRDTQCEGVQDSNLDARRGRIWAPRAERRC